LIDTLAWPTTELFITAKTPALSILTDFTQHRPLVIRSNVKAVELEKLMKQSHVKMKLVIDTQLNMIRGVISARDIARLITPNVDAAKHFSFENLYNEHKTKLAV